MLDTKVTFHTMRVIKAKQHLCVALDSSIGKNHWVIKNSIMLLIINNKAKIHILPFSNLHFGSIQFFYFTFSSNPIYQVNVSLSANETT
jgi:hypothetical protein